jgi:hypothetical protein
VQANGVARQAGTGGGQSKKPRISNVNIKKIEVTIDNLKDIYLTNQ